MGLEYSGIFKARPKDKIGLAFGTAHINDRITNQDKIIRAATGTDTPVRGREYGVEGFYAINVMPGLLLEPDAQVIVHPGGNSSQRTAVLLGFRTATTF